MSGALFASFVPIIVIIDERASVKLFTASKMMAIELTINPTVALNKTRIIFTTMPNMLVLIILFSLSMFFLHIFILLHNYI